MVVNKSNNVSLSHSVTHWRARLCVLALPESSYSPGPGRTNIRTAHSAGTHNRELCCCINIYSSLIPTRRFVFHQEVRLAVYFEGQPNQCVPSFWPICKHSAHIFMFTVYYIHWYHTRLQHLHSIIFAILRLYKHSL